MATKINTQSCTQFNKDFKLLNTFFFKFPTKNKNLYLHISSYAIKDGQISRYTIICTEFSKDLCVVCATSMCMRYIRGDMQIEIKHNIYIIHHISLKVTITKRVTSYNSHISQKIRLQPCIFFFFLIQLFPFLLNHIFLCFSFCFCFFYLLYNNTLSILLCKCYTLLSIAFMICTQVFMIGQ